jgi:hypothetical protein
MHPNYSYQKQLSLEHGAFIRKAGRLSADESLNAYQIWDMIVKAYTNANLTHGSDKLIAISALARHCQTQLGLEGDYLAGLWRRHLGHQLLWKTHPYLKGTRPSEYRAPTWSWASMDGSIFNPCEIEFSDERDMLIKVNECKMDLVSTDQFGPVSGGYISVSGQLAKVVVCSVMTDPEHPTYDLKVHLDCYISTQGVLNKDTLYENESSVVGLYQGLLVMPIRKGFDPNIRGPIYSEGGPFSWDGLLLRPVEGTEGTFHRFGIYTMVSKEEEMLFEQAFAHFDLYAEESGLRFYRNGEKGNLYTVKIE